MDILITPTTTSLILFSALYIALMVAITRKYFREGEFVLLLIYLTLIGLFPVTIDILMLLFPDIGVLLSDRSVTLIFLGPLFVGLYYLTRRNLDIKKKDLAYYSSILYLGICLALFNIAPFSNSLEITSIKSESLYRIALVVSSFGTFFWLSSLYALYQRSLNSHSLIKRNRFKAIYISQFTIGAGLISSIINDPLANTVYIVTIFFGIMILGYALFRYEHMHLSGFFLKLIKYVFFIVIGITIYLSINTLTKEIDLVNKLYMDILSVGILLLLIIPLYEPISSLFISSKEKMLFGLIRDFTDFYKADKRNEQEILRYVEEQLSSYLKVKNVHMLVFDRSEDNKFLISLGNRKLDLGNSLSPEKINTLMGSSIIELPSPSDPELNEIWEKYNIKLIFPFRKERNIIGMMLLGYKDGGETYSVVELRFLRQFANEIVLALDNYYLIEQLNLDKLSIQKLYEQEKDLSELKSDFVQITSHNLRTPITALRGYLELVQTEEDDELRANYVLKIKKHLMKLSTLTEELIAFASLAGSEDLIKLQSRLVKYDEIVQRISKDYLPLAQDKGLKLYFHNKSNKTIASEIDELKIAVVIENIIDNAIKFTDAGEINITVKLEDGFITTCIEDTGIGISKKEQKLLFKKFSRISPKNSYSQKREGTGLGLYIARLFINAHGGRIWAESVPNKGTKFTFTLPMK